MIICANLWTKRTQTTDEFYRPQMVFIDHRLAQIDTDFLISKDIVIITDFYFWHGIIIAHIQNINISNYGKKFRKGNQCHEVGADEV